MPALLIIHNVEEAVFMSRVLPLINQRIPSAFAHFLGEVRYPQVFLALLIVTAIPLAIAAVSSLEKSSPGVYLLLAMQAVLALNGLSHVAAAIVLRGYAPGLFTALAINLPFSVYLLHRARREQWLSRPAFLSLFPVAILVHGPGLAGLLLAVGALAP